METILDSPKTFFKFFSIKKYLESLLAKITHGSLTLIEKNQTKFYGTPKEGIHAECTVMDSRFYTCVFFEGSIGLAKAYSKNYFSTPDLTKLLQVFCQNIAIVDKADLGFTSLVSRSTLKVIHFFKKNTPKKSVENIAKHYDLSNDFFEQFLDPSMMYSCAKFTENTDTLLSASEAKLKLICEKLQLTEQDHILEIGTGWGSFAIFAAKHYGCRVTTTTLSQAQYDFAKNRILAEKLTHQITLLKKDYRALSGKYDKLVSIEMIEAVGSEFFKAYFKQCHRLVKEDGFFLLQTIVIRDQRYKIARDSIDFIKAFIFPGGCLPCYQQILTQTQRHTEYHLIDFEELTQDYAKTLVCWRENFLNHQEKIQALGLNEAFLKIWLFYFAYCEAAFRARQIGCAQMLFAKPLSRQY